MGLLKTVWAEFIAIFVDDVGFAVAILAWVAIAALGLPRLGLPDPLTALLLFAGLVAILLESATRRARKR